MSEIVSVENQEEIIDTVELAPPLDISHIEIKEERNRADRLLAQLCAAGIEAEV